MRRALVRNAEFAFEFRGAGQPVLLIHGTVLADSMMPLAEQPALTQKHLLVRYHRRGFGKSSPIDIPWSIEQHARDAVELLDHLGIRRAHIIAHSVGAAIALEMALDFPERVGGIVLLEAGLPRVPSAAILHAQLSLIEAMYQRGDNAAAIDQLLAALGGPDYRRVAESVLPADALDTALKDADTIFRYEAPAYAMWDLPQSIALRLCAPTLLVTGTTSLPVFAETQKVLREWFPDAAAEMIPGLGHALHMEAPDKIAHIAARFLAQNAMHMSAPA